MSGPKVKDAFSYLLCSIYSQIAGLLSILAAMQALEVTDFGFYSYIVATVTIFCFILDGAVSQGIIRSVGKNHNFKIKYYVNFQKFQLLGCIIISIFLLALSLSEANMEKSAAMLYFSIGSVLTSTVTPVFSYHIALGNKWISIKKDLSVASIRILLVIIFKYEYSSLEFLSSINIFCGLVSVLHGIKSAPSKNLHCNITAGNLSRLKETFFSIKHIILLMGANIIYNKIDIVLLKSLSTELEAAKYAGAVQFIYPLMFISSAIMTGIYPILAKQSNEKNKQRKTVIVSVAIMAATSAIIISLLLLLSNLLFVDSFHGKYTQSKEIFSVIIWYLLIVFSYGPISNALIANEKTWSLSKTTIFISIICVSLNLYAISNYGAMGAAWVKIVCEITLLLLIFNIYQKFNRNTR